MHAYDINEYASHNHTPTVAVKMPRSFARSFLETARKARRQFRDVKRQLRKRQREGEESDSEEEVMPDRQAQERELGQWVGETWIEKYGK